MRLRSRTQRAETLYASWQLGKRSTAAEGQALDVQERREDGAIQDHEQNMNRVKAMSFSSVIALALVFAASVQGLTTAPPCNVLIFGGTGFIGSNIAEQFVESGYAVTTLSRRGENRSNVPMTVIRGDATDATVVAEAYRSAKFDAIVHALGMLFEGDANRFASGSGSVPAPGATYDMITRQTAFNALDAIAAGAKRGAADPLPFVFISASEVQFKFDDKFEGTPLAWLHR